MPITEEQYNKVKGALTAAGNDPAAMSPEIRAKAQAAVDEFEAGLVKHLDSSQPLMAQALATSPATTHPEGDAAAEEEWNRNPAGAVNGTVVVYEMPLAKARKDLLEHPEKFGAMGYSRIPPTPEQIQAMDADSPIYHSYNDQEWRNTADAAAKAGKRAYRYSKAPYLQNGSLMQTLDSLGMKLKTGVAPAMDGIGSFVMGYDDTAQFGSMRQAGETQDAKLKQLGDEYHAAHPELKPDPVPAGADEVVGGIDRTDRKERNLELEEDHPHLYTAGQVLGAVPEAIAGAVKGAGKLVGNVAETVGQGIQGAAKGIEGLAPWSASNTLFNEVASGGRNILAKLGWQEGLAPVATSAATAYMGGVGTHAAQEGVRAAGNYAATGDAGTTAGDAAVRSLEAGLLPAALGAGGSLVQQGSAAAGDWVRNGGKGSISGGRYKGIPGKLERAGVEPQLGRGYVVPDAVKAAQTEARELEVPVEQVLAEKVAPKVAAGAKTLSREALPKVKLHADGAVTPIEAAPGDPATPAAMRRIAPKGDAYPAVKRFASKKGADVRETRALRAAAKRAGPEVEQELHQTRVPELLSELERLTSPTRKVQGDGVFSVLNRMGDSVVMRGAYPVLRSLEGPLGSLGSGNAGRVGIVGADDQREEKKAAEQAPRSARYQAWREEYLKRKPAARPRKRHHP